MTAALPAGDWPVPGTGGSRAAFAALLALLFWAPLPLGSNRGWSEALLAAAALGLLFSVLLAALWRDRPAVAGLGPARWPAALLAASAGFALAQTLPLPAPVIAVLSPAAEQAWQAAGVAGGSLSLDRAASVGAGIHRAALCAVFVLVAWCVTSRRRLITACVAVVVIGVLEALTGIVVELAQANGWLARGPQQGVGGASGTYVNPNHFAGLLVMCLCVSVGLHLALFPRGVLPGTGRAAARGILGFALSPRLLLVVAQLVMLVALLWSGSRGGVLAIAVAAPVVFGFVLTAESGAATRAARVALLAGMAAVAVAAVVLGGTGALGDKLAAQGFAGNRADLLLATAVMAADFPLTGAGAGSYASVFPAYKSAPLGTLFYEHAHNDYLQTVAEVGVVGAGLFFGAIAGALVAMIGRGRRRRSREARALTAGCAAAVLALLVHGLYDFNLQIPANATLFFFLLGLGLRACDLRRETTPEVLR